MEEIYRDLYYKEQIIEKFKELKIGLEFFNTFYSKFIKLVVKLKFTKEILLQEFIHKLLPQIQHKINFWLNYPDNIKDLAAYCKKNI